MGGAESRPEARSQVPWHPPSADAPASGIGARARARPRRETLIVGRNVTPQRFSRRTAFVAVGHDSAAAIAVASAVQGCPGVGTGVAVCVGTGVGTGVAVRVGAQARTEKRSPLGETPRRSVSRTERRFSRSGTTTRSSEPWHPPSGHASASTSAPPPRPAPRNARRREKRRVTAFLAQDSVSRDWAPRHASTRMGLGAAAREHPHGTTTLRAGTTAREHSRAGLPDVGRPRYGRRRGGDT